MNYSEMEEKSRTQKKKEAEYLQELGEKLLKLSDEQMRDIDLPEAIFSAVKFAKTIKSHGARRRQMQYIGTLMRKIEVGPVQEALEHIEQGNLKKALEFKELEKWRDELIAGNKNLIEEILGKCPEADRQQLTQFVRQSVREIENNKPPAASRALFRYLKALKMRAD